MFLLLFLVGQVKELTFPLSTNTTEVLLIQSLEKEVVDISVNSDGVVSVIILQTGHQFYRYCKPTSFTIFCWPNSFIPNYILGYNNIEDYDRQAITQQNPDAKFFFHALPNLVIKLDIFILLGELFLH